MYISIMHDGKYSYLGVYKTPLCVCMYVHVCKWFYFNILQYFFRLLSVS